MSKSQARKKGGVSPIDYPFMLNNTVPETTAIAKPATPAINGGRRSKGGCGCASNSLRKGGNIMPAGVELTPFISALALLGARLLADKNPSLNIFSKSKSKSKSSSLKSSSLKSSSLKSKSRKD
jgi:hypothetical protein